MLIGSDMRRLKRASLRRCPCSSSGGSCVRRASMSPGAIMRIASRARPYETSSPDGRAALAQRAGAARSAPLELVASEARSRMTPLTGQSAPAGTSHGRVTIDRHGRGIGEQRRGHDGAGSNPVTASEGSSSPSARRQSSAPVRHGDTIQLPREVGEQPRATCAGGVEVQDDDAPVAARSADRTTRSAGRHARDPRSAKRHGRITRDEEQDRPCFAERACGKSSAAAPWSAIGTTAAACLADRSRGRCRPRTVRAAGAPARAPRRRRPRRSPPPPRGWTPRARPGSPG